jgi:hypothetical protein
MTPLPPYPGATKPLSVNYTAGGEPFAIGDDVEDDLDPRDVWRVARSLEDHNHGDGRGLPINRIGTATAPQTPGDLQVQGDDFRWWGDGTDQILSAVDRETNQTVNGTKRFNQPLLLPRQISPPVAPGVGLAYLYLGPGDRLYLRAGGAAPAPVGTPGLLAAALNWNTRQGTGEAKLQQLGLGVPTWTLAFGAGNNEVATLSSVVPFTYGGVPLTYYVTWTAPAGVGKVNFEVTAGVVPVGGATNAPVNAAVSTTVDSPNTTYTHNRASFAWDTGLPLPGDIVFYTLKRNDASETAAGGTRFPAAVSVIDVGIVYG